MLDSLNVSRTKRRLVFSTRCSASRIDARYFRLISRRHRARFTHVLIGKKLKLDDRVEIIHLKSTARFHVSSMARDMYCNKSEHYSRIVSTVVYKKKM